MTARRTVLQPLAALLFIRRIGFILKWLTTAGCLILMTSCAAADKPQSALSGHYYLSGVMETGSELLLQPNGTFEWYLAYGAVDMQAQGKWEQRKAEVHLVKGAGEMPFHILKLQNNSLVPVWSNGQTRGQYDR